MYNAYMRHSLTAVDPVNMEATCAVCGPQTRLKKNYGKRAGTFRCYNKYQEDKRRSETYEKRKKRPSYVIRFRDGTKVSNQVKEALIEAQHGRCAICKDPLVVAHLDHCHQTGNIRGVLCRGCNQGLGNFRDRPDLLLAAASFVA